MAKGLAVTDHNPRPGLKGLLDPFSAMNVNLIKLHKGSGIYITPLSK